MPSSKLRCACAPLLALALSLGSAACGGTTQSSTTSAGRADAASVEALVTPYGESLPRDRQLAIARFIHDFEANPLDPRGGLEPDLDVTTILIRYITETPDVTVSLGRGVALVASNAGDASGLVVGGATFGMTAYLLEHPGADSESAATQVAGIASGLRWYEAWRRRNGPAIAGLDELIAERDRGTLDAWYARQ